MSSSSPTWTRSCAHSEILLVGCLTPTRCGSGSAAGPAAACGAGPGGDRAGVRVWPGACNSVGPRVWRGAYDKAGVRVWRGVCNKVGASLSLNWDEAPTLLQLIRSS